MAVATERFEDEQLIRAAQHYADSANFIPGLLDIVNKNGELVPFEPYETQWRVINSARRQEAENKPVRIIVLKARQFGGTTAGEGIIFHKTVSRPNQQSICISDDEDSSAYILKMSRRFHQSWCEKWDRFCDDPETNKLVPPPPIVRATNKREIVFASPLNSTLQIQLGSDYKAGRSLTVRHLHASEVPFWKANARVVMSGLLKCVPKLPGTTVIVESTANGVGGWFYETWMAAKRGENDYDPIFVPWFEVEEYRHPDGVAALGRLDSYEQGLIQEHGLDLAQIAWRRWAIENQCGRDLDQFRADYPATDIEAFVAKGKCPFDAQTIRDHYAARVARNPIDRGNFDASGAFCTEHNGSLKVWEYPIPGQEYVIGADPARGVSRHKSHDYCSAKVWRLNPLREIAEWHGYVPYPEFAKQLGWLGAWYNVAWILGESNWGGVAVLNKLVDCRYPHVMYRDQWRGREHTQDFRNLGWHTSGKTKPAMVADFAVLLKDKEVDIYSRDTLVEMLEYQQNSAGKYEARPGGNDDRVVASMIAYQAAMRRLRTMPPVDEEKENAEAVRRELFKLGGQQLSDIHSMNEQLTRKPGKQNMRLIAAVFGEDHARQIMQSRRRTRRRIAV